MHYKMETKTNPHTNRAVVGGPPRGGGGVGGGVMQNCCICGFTTRACQSWQRPYYSNINGYWHESKEPRSFTLTTGDFDYRDHVRALQRSAQLQMVTIGRGEWFKGARCDRFTALLGLHEHCSCAEWNCHCLSLVASTRYHRNTP